jgi:IS5 family transposase
MKAHIGVDDRSGLVHTVVGTTAKVSDMSQFGELLHGDEERVSADRGYDYPQIHAQLEPRLSIGGPTGLRTPWRSLCGVFAPVLVANRLGYWLLPRARIHS